MQLFPKKSVSESSALHQVLLLKEKNDVVIHIRTVKCGAKKIIEQTKRQESSEMKRFHLFIGYVELSISSGYLPHHKVFHEI